MTASDDSSWPRAAAWLASAKGADDLDLAVLGIPAWRTSLSSTGAQATPDAVRAALARFSTFAASRDVDLATLGVEDLGNLVEPDNDETATTQACAQAVGRSRLLIALGGDNSITYAAGMGLFGGDLSRCGLVTLDAHHDLRDGVSNGSPVRRLIEAGLDPSLVAQVGLADFANSSVYSARARAWGIRTISRSDVETRGIVGCVRDALETAARGGGAVYVDLDLDVCDRSVAPGCPASAPGGVSAAELRHAAFLAGAHPQVRAIDVTEVDATADAPDGRTVRLAALCLLEAAAGLARRPT